MAVISDTDTPRSSSLPWSTTPVLPPRSPRDQPTPSSAVEAVRGRRTHQSGQYITCLMLARKVLGGVDPPFRSSDSPEEEQLVYTETGLSGEGELQKEHAAEGIAQGLKARRIDIDDLFARLERLEASFQAREHALEPLLAERQKAVDHELRLRMFYAGWALCRQQARAAYNPVPLALTGKPFGSYAAFQAELEWFSNAQVRDYDSTFADRLQHLESSAKAMNATFRAVLSRLHQQHDSLVDLPSYPYNAVPTQRDWWRSIGLHLVLPEQADALGERFLIGFADVELAKSSVELFPLSARIPQANAEELYAALAAERFRYKAGRRWVAVPAFPAP